MKTRAKNTKTGNSAGVGLLKDPLANPNFAEKLALGERIMRKDRDILRVLAE